MNVHCVVSEVSLRLVMKNNIEVNYNGEASFLFIVRHCKL